MQRANHRNKIIEFIELGQFVLISKVYPQRSAWYWLGRQNPELIARSQHRVDFGGWLKFRNAIRHSDARFVFAHVPVRNRLLSIRHALRMVHGDFSGWAYRSVINECDKPLVGLDFNDDAPMSSIALQILDRSICYFKRELTVDRERLLPIGATTAQKRLFERNQHKLLPISLGLSKERLNAKPPIKQKKYDLYYSGAPTSEVRRKEIHLLESVREAGLRVHVPQERVSLHEFLKLCAQSYIVWSPEGRGWDCFRHYESALSAAVPLMNRPFIDEHRPFRHDENAMYYEPLNAARQNGSLAFGNRLPGLVETVLLLARDKARLIEMGKAAQSHVLQNHTHRKIVDHIVDASCAVLNSLSKNVA